MTRSQYKYCPCYCEENVWHLTQKPAFAKTERIVALISNPEGACLFWNQRVCEKRDEPVIWDYHVILFVRNDEWLVYDLNTALPFPTDADTYLRRTFRLDSTMPDILRPRFVLFEGDAYVEAFASDRSHMRDEQGQWLSPPPDWPVIGRENDEGFLTFVEHHMRSGSHISLEAMKERFG